MYLRGLVLLDMQMTHFQNVFRQSIDQMVFRNLLIIQPSVEVAGTVI